jgi:ubiquitin C-terminal hydrolase
LDLPIPLPKANTNTNGYRIRLTDCFDGFMADEILTGWFNEKTKEYEPVKKNITFWSFPNVLMIILKRYSPDGQYKNTEFVDFPLDNLDLSKYVVGYNANSYKYKLFGVANHMGGILGGHYTAFVHTEDKWYCFNDEHVSEVPENMIVSPAAYCLFYRKK